MSCVSRGLLAGTRNNLDQVGPACISTIPHGNRLDSSSVVHCLGGVGPDLSGQKYEELGLQQWHRLDFMLDLQHLFVDLLRKEIFTHEFRHRLMFAFTLAYSIRQRIHTALLRRSRVLWCSTMDEFAEADAS